MLGFSHNLIVETAVAKTMGIKASIVIAIRLGLAFISAIVISLFWKGGEAQAQYSMVVENQEVLTSWVDIGILSVKTAALGVWQIAIIVVPLMFAIQVLKDIDAINILSKWFEPLTRVLGLSSGKASVPLLAGIIFGLAYGAGVIADSVRDNEISKRDLYLLTIFLVSSHAVIEDTVLFIPLGINVLPLLFIRVTVAFIVTMLTARLWVKLASQAEFISKGEAK